ncbi:MAG: type IV pili methyl-accepting chemotaxis transducer N-terminal domain-containing protein, partial [Gammaproteobacteria bacterium]
MRREGRLSTKFLLLSLLLLSVALVSIGLTIWATRQLDGGAAAVNEAGRMRMQTYRLALAASTSGPSGETLGLIRSFDASVALL